MAARGSWSVSSRRRHRHDDPRRGALPASEAVLAEAWPTYERGVKARGALLEADGRGHHLDAAARGRPSCGERSKANGN